MSHIHHRSHGGSSRKYIDLRYGGTFTRSTEGSGLISAPTDGTTAFLKWWGVNERRIENRGDGLGDMLLMEGARTNRMQQSRDITLTPWDAATYGTISRTAAYGPGPDGATKGNRFTVIAGSPGGYGYPQSVAGLMANPHRQSFWVRGTAAAQSLFTNYSGVILSVAVAGTTYQRFDRNSANTGGSLYLIDTTTSTFPAQDSLFDLIQAEDGNSPSSAIRTTTTSVTRGADLLSYAVGKYPASFLTQGFRMKIAPDFSSAEGLAAGLNVAFIGQSANAYMLLSPTNFMDFYGGAIRIAKSATDLTWSRGQVLTITASPGGGWFKVEGATTGNGTFTGTARPWTAVTTFIGDYTTGGLPFFGRIHTIIEAI